MLYNEKYTIVFVEEEDSNSMGIDRMDGMLEDMLPKFNLNIGDEPMLEVKEFLRLLKVLKEPLHKHTKCPYMLLCLASWLLSRFFLQQLLQWSYDFFWDVLLKPHKTA